MLAPIVVVQWLGHGGYSGEQNNKYSIFILVDSAIHAKLWLHLHVMFFLPLWSLHFFPYFPPSSPMMVENAKNNSPKAKIIIFAAKRANDTKLFQLSLTVSCFLVFFFSFSFMALGWYCLGGGHGHGGDAAQQIVKVIKITSKLDYPFSNYYFRMFLWSLKVQIETKFTTVSVKMWRYFFLILFVTSRHWWSKCLATTKWTQQRSFCWMAIKRRLKRMVIGWLIWMGSIKQLRLGLNYLHFDKTLAHEHKEKHVAPMKQNHAMTPIIKKQRQQQQ